MYVDWDNSALTHQLQDAQRQQMVLCGTHFFNIFYSNTLTQVIMNMRLRCQFKFTACEAVNDDLRLAVLLDSLLRIAPRWKWKKRNGGPLSRTIRIRIRVHVIVVAGFSDQCGMFFCFCKTENNCYQR